MVVGDVTVGNVMICPSGRVVVPPPVMSSGPVVVELGPRLEVKDGGKRVKVSPSVIRVVGAVKPVGRVMGGFVPIIMTPLLDMMVWPSDAVNVVATFGSEDVDNDDEGNKVKVSPSVTRVVGEVRLVGSVIGGFVPMITTPELEMIVWPSGATKVVPETGDVELDVGDGVDRVNVSPSVVRVVTAVGRVIGGFVPIITTPELEMMV